jgi:hypothetical protein
MRQNIKREKECDLLRGCKKTLEIYKALNLLSFRRIHSMPVIRGNGGFSKNIDMAGMEDLQIYLPAGVTLHVELKTNTGKQSDRQIERENELKTLGHHYFVVRSLDQLVILLETFGVTMPFVKGIK